MRTYITNVYSIFSFTLRIDRKCTEHKVCKYLRGLNMFLLLFSTPHFCLFIYFVFITSYEMAYLLFSKLMQHLFPHQFPHKNCIFIIKLLWTCSVQEFRKCNLMCMYFSLQFIHEPVICTRYGPNLSHVIGIQIIPTVNLNVLSLKYIAFLHMNSFSDCLLKSKC